MRIEFGKKFAYLWFYQQTTLGEPNEMVNIFVMTALLLSYGGFHFYFFFIYGK